MGKIIPDPMSAIEIVEPAKIISRIVHTLQLQAVQEFGIAVTFWQILPTIWLRIDFELCWLILCRNLNGVRPTYRQSQLQTYW